MVLFSVHRARILGEVWSVGGVKRVLVEEGPRLLADFFRQRLVSSDAGAADCGSRGGRWQAGGKVFAPRNPLWGQLIDVRQAQVICSCCIPLRDRRGGPRRISAIQPAFETTCPVGERVRSGDREPEVADTGPRRCAIGRAPYLQFRGHKLR